MSNHKNLWSGAVKLLMELPVDFNQIYANFRPEWADFTYKSEEDLVAFRQMLSFLFSKEDIVFLPMLQGWSHLR